MTGNVAGIDPGLEGALCVMKRDGTVLDLLDLPAIVMRAKPRKVELDEPRIRDILTEWEVGHCYLERAQAMPKQGIVSTGNYMAAYGLVRGILVGLGVPYTLVLPATWKKSMMPDMTRGEKGADMVRAKQLFPDLELDRVKDHHRADAVLICEYGRRALK